MPGRLAKLEGAISKQRTVKFDYWSISRDELAERTREPVRADAGQRRLVRRRLRPRPRGHPHVPRLAHPRRDQVRDAARARLPHADRLRHRAVPRPAAVAGRRDHRRGADRGARRHRLVGPARVRPDRPPRGRHLRHRLLLPLAARLVGAAAGRPRSPARARGAAPRGCGVAPPGARRARGQGARAGPRVAGARRRRPRRPPCRAGRARSASPCSRRCSRTSSPPAASRRRR